LEQGGPITERTLRELRGARATRALPARLRRGRRGALPGHHVRRQAQGRRPRLTVAAIDGACSFALAQTVAGEKRQEQAIAFLVERVLPVYAEAGIELAHVTSDRGVSSGAPSGRRLQQRGIRHRRLPPRSPNLNGFAEQLHRTILHEHYRVAFRLRYYASAADVDADLQGFMRHYNFGPPHRRRGPQGATPASRFYAHAPAFLTAKGW
ncbi:MAG: integrase core domain-containing protein, partial [Actinomycetota bacterium]|nr:integrase core domain-containing protein [Actinomycetota bacterium]